MTDVIADEVVVPLESGPVHGHGIPEYGPRQAGNDRDLGQQAGSDRRDPAMGAVHCTDRILDRDELRSGGLEIHLGATHRRQDQRLRADDRVRAVELRRYLHGHLGAVHCLLGRTGVRDCGDEIASEGKPDLHLAALHPLDRLEGIRAVGPGRCERELLLDGVEELIVHLLPHPHGAVTLHVAVAADRGCSGPGLADVAAEQQQVDQIFQGVDRLLVLGKTHRPGDDNPIGGDVALGKLVDLCRGEAGGEQHGRFIEVAKMFGEGIETEGEFVEKGVVEHCSWLRRLRVEHALRDGLQ